MPMARRDDHPANAAEQPQPAQERVRQEAASPLLEAISPENTRQTLDELRLHQTELEAQAQELRRTQAELDALRGHAIAAGSKRPRMASSSSMPRRGGVHLGLPFGSDQDRSTVMCWMLRPQAVKRAHPTRVSGDRSALPGSVARGPG
jgi:hypothetical protein